MKPWWLVVGVAACVIPATYVEPPAPATAPAQAQAPAPAPAAQTTARDRQLRAIAQRIAAAYDDVFDRIAAADRDTSSHRDEQAAAGYRNAVSAADQLLASIRAGAASLRYSTRHDGAIDGTLLIANLRAARSQAAHLADEAQERFIEALEVELRVKTPGQRAVLRQHGRPDVTKVHGQICWSYPDERFCWASDGRLAKRTTTAAPDSSQPVATTSTPPDTRDTRDTSASSAPPPPAKSSIAYYAAATFAAGSCSFGDCLKSGWSTETPGGTVRTSCSFGDCAKSGWTSDHPDGSQSRTSCNFGDCFKSGWSTQHPDNTSSETSCSFGDCMKSGWTTSNPDGTQSTTSCSFGDCAKSGWSTQLPSGQSVSCSCNFGDCLTNGASCS